MDWVEKNWDIIKNKILAISRIRDDDDAKQDALNEIKKAFEESCNELKTKILETLKPLDTTDTPADPIDFLSLFIPGKDAGIETELAKFFTEESIEETSFINLENGYNPEDMINAAENIQKDLNGFPDAKRTGRSLKESFERISENIFMPKMNSRSKTYSKRIN